MSQQVRRVRAIAGAILVLGSVFVVAAMTRGACAEVITVNGERITAYDVAQRTTFDQLARHRDLSRQEVIDELIDEQRKVQAAQQAGIDVADSDVERAYAAMAKRMNLTPEQLTGALAHAGVDADTLKRRIRADIAWQQLARGRGSPMRVDDPSARRKKDDGPSWRE